MFDDQPTTNQTGKGQAPPNLPTASPPQTTKANAQEPEDILDEVDAVEPMIKGPAQGAVPPLSESAPPAVPPPEKSSSQEPLFGQKKKIIAGLAGLVVLAVFGGAAWYGYSLLVSSRFGSSSVQTQTPSQQNQQGITANTNQQGSAPSEQASEPVQPVDTDRDGLTDEEEALYGTDQTLVDTDLDGLTDRDEVLVFKTDPNNPDTDGDGFADGEEVRGGYDPKGPGRLLEIEQ